MIVVLHTNQIFTRSKCSLHTVEDVKQYGTRVEVETISFDAILKELLSLVKSAQKSHFEIIRENFISAEPHICMNSGSSLEIGTVNICRHFNIVGGTY